MSYAVKILTDSLSPSQVRLTTFEVTFPRFLLAEFNTHRAFSRNSASSRAIPPELIIKEVKLNPFVPEFNKRIKGMGVGDPLVGSERAAARNSWLYACRESVKVAEQMLELDIDKSRINRLLEPYMWHKALITATEWSNFYALRTAEGAQPEFQIIAKMMLEEHQKHAPTQFDYGMWHLPLITFEESAEAQHNPDYWKKVSVGRCARISYLTHDGKRDPEEDVRMHDKLMTNGHMSPFEHQAFPMRFRAVKLWSGNFYGWSQYRQSIPHQEDYSKVLRESGTTA